MPGYVRSERDKVDHPALLNPIAHALFDWLFHKAARKPVKVNWRGHTIALKRGEVAFSLSEWISKRAEFDFVTRKRVRRIIERFVREDMITVGYIHASIVMQSASEGGQGGAKVLGQGRGQGQGALGMLIRVCNYDRYQAELAAKSAPRGQGLCQPELAIGAKVGPTERDSRDSRPLFDKSQREPKAPISAPTPNGSGLSKASIPRSKGNQKQKRRLPVGFEVDGETVSFCLDRKCDGNRLKYERILAKFRDHMKSSGKRSEDWQAECRLWFGHEEEHEHEQQRRTETITERMKGAKRPSNVDEGVGHQ